MSATREGRVALFRVACLLSGALLIHLAGPRAGWAQEEVFPLEGLVVTASPTALEEDAVSRHVTILDGEDLERSGARSLADALRDVPGIHAARSGSFGGVTSLFLRGGESDYTLVLVDGVQVNQAGGGFDFAELTTDAVERVEIVRGPASALYGSDAVTGVIHVITRTGRGAPSSTFGVEGGAFGRLDWSADVRGGGASMGYGVSVARRTSDGIYAFNNGSAQTVVSGAARFRPDDRTRIHVDVRASEREYHFPTNSAGEVVDENAFTFSDATTVSVSATRGLTSRLSIEASVGVNETDGGSDDAVDGPADTLGFFGFTSLDHFRRTVGEVRAHVRFDPATFTGGFEYDEERQRSFTESRSEFGTSADRSESRRDNYAGFLHAVGRLGPLTYQLGARLEDNERFGRSATWQAGLATPLAGDSSPIVRASVGTAIKEPTFFENFATGFAVGNPDLDPERSLAWEVGVEHDLADGVSASATWFRQSFRDLIQYTAAPPGPDDPSFFNVAEARARGLELDLDAGRGPWSVGASLTWTDTEVLDSGFQEGEGATFVEGEPLLRRPEWQGGVRGALDVGVVELSLGVRSVGERSDRDFAAFPATPVSLEAYRLLSAGVRWSVVEPGGGSPGVTLELRGENLLDETYQELLGFPGPGRGLYVGGRLGLGR